MISPGFINRSQLAADLLGQLDELALKKLGLVFVRKNQDPNPLTSAGFHQWEAAFMDDLQNDTAAARDEAAAEVNGLIDRTSPYQSKEAYGMAIILGLIVIFNQLRDRTSPIANSLSKERTRLIAQSAGDNWYLNGIGPSRDLSSLELSTLAALAQNNGFYVSRFLTDTQIARARTIIGQSFAILGDDPSAVADVLRVAFEGQIGATRSYWRPYAVSVLNQARSYGSLVQFAWGGVKNFEYYNPQDERTTAFCNAIAGTTISVNVAMDHMERVSKASSIQELERIAPFVKPGSDAGSYVVTRDGEDTEFTEDEITPSLLADLGCLTPPFHNECRTLIVPA